MQENATTVFFCRILKILAYFASKGQWVLTEVLKVAITCRINKALLSKRETTLNVNSSGREGTLSCTCREPIHSNF